MRTKKRICLLVAFVILLATLLMPVAYASDEEYVKWEVSNKSTELYRDGKKYSLYQNSRYFYLDPRTVYVFENTVQLSIEESYEYDEELPVNAPNEDAEFVWVSGYSNNYLYASNSGAAELDAFLNGTTVHYTIEHDGMNADIANSEVQGLDDMSIQPINAITVEVSKLKTQERYDVIARDRTYTLAYVHGAIYYIDGQYYYLNYETLGNNYFDADGNFSYRSGSVAITPVDAMTASVLSQTIDALEYIDIEYTYENERGTSIDDADAILEAMFWIIYILIGIIVPTPILVLGLVMPIVRRKKVGAKAMRWLVFAALAALWLILAVLLGILMII